MDTQDLEVWYKTLKEVKLDDRPPLSSDERQALLNATDDAAQNPKDMKSAMSVAALLARLDGQGTPPPFKSQILNKVHRVESQPVTPANDDPRMKERVIAGRTVFKSREFEHVGKANVVHEGKPGRQVAGKRLDVVHVPSGYSDKFEVYAVSTKAHVPYDTGLLSKSDDIDKKYVDTFKSYQAATAYIDKAIGVPRHSEQVRQKQMAMEVHSAKRNTAPRPR